MHDSFQLSISLQNGEVSHLVTAFTAPGLLPGLAEGAGGSGLVDDAGGAGGGWMLGATGRHQANSANQENTPSRKCLCWKSANAKAVETVADRS